ncbi:hypothetical protein GGI04_002264 [Coemansia thaxteri]|nr:hypothetical protein GGI04_002264 [Coemansia thaxteri]
MTVESEREKRAEAIEKRLGSSNTATNGYFPGTGRTISGVAVDEDDDGESDGVAEPEDAEGDAGSDFDEEYQSGDEEEEEDDDASYDSEEQDGARGGSSIYNLRTPNSKRKLSHDGASDSEGEDEGPSLRTRQKLVPARGSVAKDDENEDEDEDDEDEDEI